MGVSCSADVGKIRALLSRIEQKVYKVSTIINECDGGIYIKTKWPVPHIYLQTKKCPFESGNFLIASILVVKKSFE